MGPCRAVMLLWCDGGLSDPPPLVKQTTHPHAIKLRGSVGGRCGRALCESNALWTTHSTGVGNRRVELQLYLYIHTYIHRTTIVLVQSLVLHRGCAHTHTRCTPWSPRRERGRESERPPSAAHCRGTDEVRRHDACTRALLQRLSAQSHRFRTMVAGFCGTQCAVGNGVHD